MDKSETYIKMRLGAIPNLGLGKPVLNDTFRVTEGVVVDTKGDFYIHCDIAPYACQLERQDQLQEMAWDIGAGYSSWFNLLKDFYNFTSTNPSAKLLTSMEQLWLSFCMSGEYGKIWSDKEWVRE